MHKENRWCTLVLETAWKGDRKTCDNCTEKSESVHTERSVLGSFALACRSAKHTHTLTHTHTHTDIHTHVRAHTHAHSDTVTHTHTLRASVYARLYST